jgi:hypothetical protein
MTPLEAMQEAADREGAVAITLAGRCFAAERAEAHRLETTGVGFAYLCDVHGEIVTVPVN